MNERVRITSDGVIEIDLHGLWVGEPEKIIRTFFTFFEFEWNETRRADQHRITAWLPDRKTEATE